VADLGPGLYELLITEGLRAQLDELAQALRVDDRALNSADASDRIAWHVSQQIERALLDVSEERRVEVGLNVARELIDRLGELVTTDSSARSELSISMSSMPQRTARARRFELSTVRVRRNHAVLGLGRSRVVTRRFCVGSSTFQRSARARVRNAVVGVLDLG
jgi:hypothetical protein